GGALLFEGIEYGLTVNHTDGTALHGEAYDAPWDVIDDGRLRHVGHGAFPWRYTAELELDIASSGFKVTLTVTNIDRRAMPAGVGLHPWFAAPLSLALPAALVYPAARGHWADVPTPVSGATDFRSLRPVRWGLDAPWAGLTTDTARLVVAGVDLELRWSTTVTTVMVNSHEPFGAVAIEPQSHAPDGFGRLANGAEGGVAVLQPGEQLSLWMALRPHRPVGG
ncbi:MAG TPA: hypothetical protein VM030_00115, partial [Acidimicrobiales bacterium]|nr:hypothetical protein [Acidimicrobiales bacterium]